MTGSARAASPFGAQARWTRWANGRLFDACAQLSEADYKARRPCAFGSIHGTLNHLLAADRIWLARLTGTRHAIPSLDFEVCASFEELRTARRAEDERLIAVVDEIIASRDLADMLRYTSFTAGPRETPLNLVLAHVFLHHAHHRGQVHALLSQTPVAPPSMDLMYFPLDEA